MQWSNLQVSSEVPILKPIVSAIGISSSKRVLSISSIMIFNAGSGYARTLDVSALRTLCDGSLASVTHTKRCNSLRKALWMPLGSF